MKPNSFNNLSAITFDGKCVNIPNQVLRKPEPFEEHDKLNDNSICMVSNYKFYTDPIENWSPKIKAICHPYNYKKARVFPDDKRIYVLSESDFSDEIFLPIQKIKNRKKKYDFAYFTYDSRQGMKCKGLFVLPLMMELAHKAKMRGIVIDYHPIDLEKRSHEKSQLGSHGQHLRIVRKSMKKWQRRGGEVEIKRGRMPLKNAIETIYQSRFVVFPNTHDASPKIITEALCIGTPVLVNRCIDEINASN